MTTNPLEKWPPAPANIATNPEIENRQWNFNYGRN